MCFGCCVDVVIVLFCMLVGQYDFIVLSVFVYAYCKCLCVGLYVSCMLNII